MPATIGRFKEWLITGLGCVGVIAWSLFGLASIVWFAGHYGFILTVLSLVFPPLFFFLLVYTGFHDHNWWPLAIIFGSGFALQALLMVGHLIHTAWSNWRSGRGNS
jgi:hypothetical protein